MTDQPGPDQRPHGDRAALPPPVAGAPTDGIGSNTQTPNLPPPPRVQPAPPGVNPSEQPRSGQSSPFLVAKNDSPPSGSGRRPIAPIMAGVLAVGALGLILWFFLGGRGTSGADSPEEAVQQVADVFEGGDQLDLLNVVAPSEVEPYRDVIDAMLAKFGDIDGITDEFTRSAGEGWDQALAEAGVSIRVEFTEINTTEVADAAAIVEFDGYVYVDVDDDSDIDEMLSEIEDGYGSDGIVERTETGVRFRLGGIADEIDIGRFDRLSVVTVKEDGRWYLSPMMTTANVITEILDEPAPDLDAVGQPLDNGADSGEEVIDQYLEAMVEGDFVEATQMMSLPYARLGQAFPKSIRRLEQTYRDGLEDSDGAVEVRDLQLDDLGSGLYGIDRVEIAVDSYGDTETVVIDHDCVEAGADTECLLEYAPDGLRFDSLVVATDKVGNAYVVDPARSWTVLFEDWLDNNDTSFILARLGLAQYDTPIEAELDTDVEVSFGDKGYVVLEIADPGSIEALMAADVEVDREDATSKIYLDHQPIYDWALQTPSSVDDPDEQPTLQVVIFRDRGNCGPIYCSNDFTVDDETFTVRIVSAQY